VSGENPVSITVTRPQMTLLRRGKTVTIPDTELRLHRNVIYDVRCRNRRTVEARAIIIKTEGDQVRIQLVYQQGATMLARRSAHGYTDDPTQAMFLEPEAIGPENLQAMTREMRERRHMELTAFKYIVQTGIEHLSEHATRAEKRALRHLGRVADALSGKDHS
jgi:hypothetical protein